MKFISPACLLAKWKSDTGGMAAVEFGLIFPALMIMLMGVYEVGTGIMINQKSIAASQIVADLIARNTVVTDDIINQAINAGKIALDPYSTTPLGFDIVSIQYDSANKPKQVWRETRNMKANDDGLNRSIGLGTSGDGALAVTVTYNYKPVTGYILQSVPIEEISFARGRRTGIIQRD